jgi:hypothetical protein
VYSTRTCTVVRNYISFGAFLHEPEVYKILPTTCTYLGDLRVVDIIVPPHDRNGKVWSLHSGLLYIYQADFWYEEK